ncbi:MAG TPA: hypothetical protein VFQ88_03955 [Nevskiaceae bacterium]|nr:hypothetical protein [Nevskiaceae bacterium]
MAATEAGQGSHTQRPGTLAVSLVFAFVLYFVLRFGLLDAFDVHAISDGNVWGAAKILIEVVSVLGFVGGYALGTRLMRR